MTYLHLLNVTSVGIYGMILSASFCDILWTWRRRLALLAAAVFSGIFAMQDMAELAVTLPLLFILRYFIAPSVRSISHCTVSLQCQFGLMPAIYYGFAYLTRIYTDMFWKGELVAVEFMPFVCSAAYLFFVVRSSNEGRIRDRLEQVQKSLYLQAAQAVREIETLRESQRQNRIYRHDLRHHMQYLLSCLENGRIEQAQSHIYEICSQMESHPLTFYCENEAANLIFSSFAGRMKNYGIPVKIMVQIPQQIHVSESDMCILLSNALENALNACQGLKKGGKPASIEVTAYEKKGKLFFQCINSCGEDIVFENGIPVTENPGHGIGVRSICAVVERYGGIYTFSAHTNKFILRVSL